MVLHTCSPSYSGGWGRRITWTQEAVVAVSWDCTTALQLGDRVRLRLSKQANKKKTKLRFLGPPTELLIRQGLRMCISNKFLGDDNIAGPGTTFWKALHHSIMWYQKLRTFQRLLGSYQDRTVWIWKRTITALPWNSRYVKTYEFIITWKQKQKYIWRILKKKPHYFHN